MPDEPDLSAELDDADLIISGKAAEVRTEWGVRLEDGSLLTNYGDGGSAAARKLAAWSTPPGMAVIKRKVIVGNWEDAD
jgi:hypothetical protein